jgi:protein-tyrosine phosphatase
MPPAQRFVDIHSHMIPSGDDGVRSVDEGLELLREAAQRGTAVQYGTPHVTDGTPLTASRRRRVESACRELAGRAARFGVRLELGWELSPLRSLLDLDPGTLTLGPLAACLLELPLPHTRPLSLALFEECARHIEAAGLTPIVAHPERCDIVQQRPELLHELRESGRLLQVNGDSLLGKNGPAPHHIAWHIIDGGLCDLVGSDGHRGTRPPYLDKAFAAVEGRIGADAAEPLFDGSALHPLERDAERRSAAGR